MTVRQPRNAARSRKANAATPAKARAKRAQPSYVHAAETLRRRILSGQLAPGEKLPPENELSDVLKVSRSTAREALRLLASERLIEARRGVSGGVFVVHPSGSDVQRSMNTAFSLMTRTGELRLDEIIEAWLMVAPAAAALAAERRTDEEAAQLLALSAPLPKSATDEEWVSATIRFSQFWVESTHNRLLPLLMQPLAEIIPARLRPYRDKPGWWHRNAEDYRRLAEAIERRDAAAAFDVMDRHIRKYTVPLPGGSARKRAKPARRTASHP